MNDFICSDELSVIYIDTMATIAQYHLVFVQAVARHALPLSPTRLNVLARQLQRYLQQGANTI